MGWLRDWKRRRILRRHRIDDALWQRARKHLPFLRGLSADEERRLKEFAVVFLAEKQLTPVQGLGLSDDDRVEIALQACLPVLELGLDWYDGWVGIVVHPSDFHVQRRETGDDGVVHEWDDQLAGESWPGGPVVLLGSAGRFGQRRRRRRERGDPRIRAQARHDERRTRRRAAAALARGARTLGPGVRRRV
jgi:Mlc titration factor MtfA (ptsG expression regulator)